MNHLAWIELGTVLHIVTAAAASLHAIQIKREASSALLWLFLIWSFPLVGAAVYVVWGIDRIAAKAGLRGRVHHAFRGGDIPPMVYWRRVREDHVADPPTEWSAALHRAVNALEPDFPLLKGNEIDVLVTGDEAYAPMFDAIRAARHHVHLQTFILSNDATGRALMDLLVERARDGVGVRLLFDRFGSTPAVLSGFVARYRRASPRLRVAGWSLARPWRRQFQVNLRNHRKILIADGRVAFTGGLNLADINVSRPGRPADRDFHFEVRGPAVHELQFSFLSDWHFATGEPSERLLTDEFFPPVSADGSTLARIVNGEPTIEGETLPDIVFALLTSARRQIILVTPYFVPTADILRALRSAALRGVDVKVLVPRFSNHAYAGWAGRSYYGAILQAGGRIVERRPPFMHAKALIVDDAVALIGSANMDSRSLRLNYETNILAEGEGFIGRLKAAVLDEFRCGEEIDPAAWARRPLRVRLLERACALLSPVL